MNMYGLLFAAGTAMVGGAAITVLDCAPISMRERLLVMLLIAGTALFLPATPFGSVAPGNRRMRIMHVSFNVLLAGILLVAIVGGTAFMQCGVQP